MKNLTSDSTKFEKRDIEEDNIISLSCHEQVCLSGLCFERYFSHHRAYYCIINKGIIGFTEFGKVIL